MTFNSPPPSLEAARAVLAGPAQDPALNDLLARLPGLDDQSIKDLSILVFDLIGMEQLDHHAAILSQMIKARPEWIEQKSPNGNSPVVSAVSSNRLDLVRVLLDAGASTKHTRHMPSGVLDNAIRLGASVEDQYAMGSILLEKIPLSQLQKDQRLHAAASECNLGMVRVLLEIGADFGVLKNKGNALGAACFMDEWYYRSQEVVGEIIATQKGKQAINEGWGTPHGAAIHQAAAAGNIGIIKMLIDARAFINVPDQLQADKPETPLMSAALALQPSSIAFLLKQGCDASAVDFNGGNALHHLCGAPPSLTAYRPGQQIECFGLLLAAGTDPFLTDRDGATPLDVARANESTALIEALCALTSSLDLAEKTMHIEGPGPSSTRPGPRF